MNTRQMVIAKMNQNQEADVKPFTWNTTPRSLRRFWLRYFEEQKKFKNL